MIATGNRCRVITGQGVKLLAGQRGLCVANNGGRLLDRLF
jgi:hypothetical protein